MSTCASGRAITRATMHAALSPFDRRPARRATRALGETFRRDTVRADHTRSMIEGMRVRGDDCLDRLILSRARDTAAAESPAETTGKLETPKC